MHARLSLVHRLHVYRVQATKTLRGLLDSKCSLNATIIGSQVRTREERARGGGSRVTVLWWQLREALGMLKSQRNSAVFAAVLILEVTVLV